MNLFHLRYFVKLAHEKHYTKAAEQLCITQPSLSHAISQLEKEMGVPLFEKNNRNTELTCCGKQFLAYVENALTTLDSGVETMQRSAKGEGLIRLGILRTLGVDYIPDLVAKYRLEHAGENVEFTFGINMTPELLDSLLAHKFDIVFASKPSHPHQFDYVPVEKQDLVLIVPKKHPLTNHCTVDLRETLDYPYILFDKNSGLRDIVNNMFKQIDAIPKVAYEISEDQVIAGMVARNFGIAVVPFMDVLLKLNVKILPISYPSYERKFYMITDNQVYQTSAIRNFKQFVVDNSTIT